MSPNNLSQDNHIILKAGEFLPIIETALDKITNLNTERYNKYEQNLNDWNNLQDTLAEHSAELAQRAKKAESIHKGVNNQSTVDIYSAWQEKVRRAKAGMGFFERLFSGHGVNIDTVAKELVANAFVELSPHRQRLCRIYEDWLKIRDDFFEKQARDNLMLHTYDSYRLGITNSTEEMRLKMKTFCPDLTIDGIPTHEYRLPHQPQLPARVAESLAAELQQLKMLDLADDKELVIKITTYEQTLEWANR